MNLTAGQALRIPEFVSAAEAQDLVRWSEEAAPILEAFVRRPVMGRQPAKAVRQEAHQAHVVLALLATIVQADRAYRSLAQEREQARGLLREASIRLLQAEKERDEAEVKLAAVREAIR